MSIKESRRPTFEQAVIDRMKEGGFLEVEIRVECLARSGDGYYDGSVDAYWHFWNTALDGVVMELPLAWKPQGEANFYAITENGNWLAIVQLNGELLREAQEEWMRLFTGHKKVALPEWAPCNPGCDPEFNGQRSAGCARYCENARAAMLVAAPAPVSEAKAQGVVIPERMDLPGVQADFYGSRALDEIARLNAAPAQHPKCKTCDDNGMIGGPSFYAPDEGGEPCPHCAAAPDAVEVLRAVQEQFNRFGERFPDGFDGRVFRWVDDAVAAYALDGHFQQVSVPDGWRLVKVGIEGVQFGNAWFSHEGITGYTADQLNSGNCRITGRAYMDWLAAAQAAPAADGWISVSERLPLADGQYWCFFSEEHPSTLKQRVCIFIERQQQFCDSTVTHWMPLPAAPTAYRDQGVPSAKS